MATNEFDSAAAPRFKRALMLSACPTTHSGLLSPLLLRDLSQLNHAVFLLEYFDLSMTSNKTAAWAAEAM
jgi:hypothetical protein